MSRAYEMSVRIEDPIQERTENIIAACMREWDFEMSFIDHSGSIVGQGPRFELEGRGEGNLCGGETEKDFVRRLSGAIWTANGAFCQIEIDEIYLDDPPTEHFTLDRSEYELWQKRSEA